MDDIFDEVILVCEPSQEGIFTAVYRAYEWKLEHARTRIQPGEDDLNMFARYRQVETDAAAAAKVARTLVCRFGQKAYEDICCALASEVSDRAQAVYETIVLGLAGTVRGRLLEALTYPCVHRVFELARRVHKEEHRMKMFVRFRELEGGILFSQIEPDADVLAMVMPHFADRFPMENFMIADTRRGIAGVHAAGQEWFMLHLQDQDRFRLEHVAAHYTDEEREMAELFRRFCSSISIRERGNRKLQQQFMPLKYRSFMTECENGS